MNHRKLSLPIAAITAAALAAAIPLPAAAQAAEKKSLALRSIMAELGRNMQAVTDAISREDWARVASIAPRIADHPQPPVAERVRVLAYIGTDVPRFKGFDEQAHKAAQALQAAAERGDGEAVIASFADVQRACLGCHQTFRKPFIEHFYGRR